MERRDMINYIEMPEISDEQGLEHQNGPTSSSFSKEESDEAVRRWSILDDLTSFKVATLGETQSSEGVVLNTLEDGQSSGAKRKLASENKLQKSRTTIMSTQVGKLALELQGDGAKEGLNRGDKSKQQIRKRCAELHNQNERIRRQTQKEKLQELQELIPNCNKRDKSSTLDDAIKYIKTLQYQLLSNERRAMPTGEGYSTSHSPMVMMQQAGQQGMHMMQTFPQICSNAGGMGYNWMGFPAMNAPLPHTNPYFLSSSPTNPYFLSSSTTSPSDEAPSCMDWTPFYNPVSPGPEPTALEGPMSEQSLAQRESAARVLPSKVVHYHATKEAMDCGSSNSTSNEWPHRTTAREAEEHKFQRNKSKFRKD